MTKERPIIFSGPEVRAILDGNKTQTRRVVKRDLANAFDEPRGQKDVKAGYPFIENQYGEAISAIKLCPYGQPGDRLWVRETWADVNCEEGPAICYRANGAVRTWHEFSETFGPNYGAGPSMDYEAYPGDYTMWWFDLLRGEPDHGWRRSSHMPRWAGRITPELTGVRVERVQDISFEDAAAEGIAQPEFSPLSDDWEPVNYPANKESE